MKPANIVAKILLETQSVSFNTTTPFILTSGKKSPVYVDCRRLISYPRARQTIMKLAAEYIQNTIGYESIDMVAGGETAGIPFAAWISDLLMLPMLYVRKKPKGFGKNASIEGELNPGTRFTPDEEAPVSTKNILLVEDLATDGGSKVNFVNSIRETGATCNHCFTIFQYGIFPDTVKELDKSFIKLHSLADWFDVIEVAAEQEYFSNKTLEDVRSFLNNPTEWQERHSSL